MEILDVNLAESAVGQQIADLSRAQSWPAVGAPLSLQVEHARHLVDQLGYEMRAEACEPTLYDFVSNPKSPAGLAVLHGLHRSDDARRSFLLLGEYLGSVVKFPGEGDYLIEVREDVSKAASKRPGFNNSREFFPHTDLSYVDSPPVFFCLHSLANDAKQGGLSEFIDVRELVASLSPEHVSALRQDDFLFPAPPHYRGGGAVGRAIIEVDPGSGQSLIRFRRDNLRSLSRQGIDAVVELCRQIQLSMVEVFLEPNAVAIIDNRRVLHGRTAFLGGAESSEPRHINRLYFDLEPADGIFSD